MLRKPTIRLLLMALLAVSLPRVLHAGGRTWAMYAPGESALVASCALDVEGVLGEADSLDWDDRTRNGWVPQLPLADDRPTGRLSLPGEDPGGQASSDWSLFRQGSLLTA
ncbi:MAG: hypothetical protein BWX88_05316 [Planctomycetes bacterium ADurb.Bin126]|nr:MAG: hypothetical protein BWX88_05316 [Planctomycetes bacterium ADurb.Bin126]